MKDTDKPTKKRSVSKPRLLKALWAVLEEHKLQDDDPIHTLEAAIEKDIVADSMK